MWNADKIRAEFPILDQKIYGKQLVYLDNGATAQKPRVVTETIDLLHNKLNANIHRGVHFLSEQCTELYEQARQRVCSFINAASTREVVFTSGTTASINLVAHSYGQLAINQGDNVIVSEMEHHADIVSWQLVCAMRGAQLRVIPFDDEGRLQVEKLTELIDERTKIVCVTQASNVLGSRPDLEFVIKTAHSAGVPVLVDGAQGIVHGGVDVQALDCDFYVFSGHKLYAPTGIGILYAKEKWLEQMPPYMGGGDMVKTVTFEHTDYAELPLKFEAGTTNYIGAIGLGEAINFLQGLDLKAAEQHETHLMKMAAEKLSAIDGLRIYGNCPDKCAIVSFNVEGAHPYDLGMIMDKMGVAVRTGTHCAEPIMTHYGVTGMVRASFAMYNTEQEVEMLYNAVSKAVSMLR
ncbi:MAG: SufS family cysteine desulfurase [Rikenellaceae bacterium]|nr:SufS family cysteine desulfurase [Rikenellaceae bacterium]